MAGKANVMGYEFEGSYSVDGSFNSVAGIYLITDSQGNIVDVGETEDLKDRIPNHERRDCWARNDGVNLWFHGENNGDQRLVKEKSIRDKHNPVCGVI